MYRFELVAGILCIACAVCCCQDRQRPKAVKVEAAAPKEKPDETPPVWAGGGLQVLEARRAGEKERKKGPPELPQFVITFLWPAAEDAVGVTGFELRKDGKVVARPDPAKRQQEVTTIGTATGKWELAALDAAGNRSVALAPGKEALARLEKVQKLDPKTVGLLGLLRSKSEGAGMRPIFGRDAELAHARKALKGLLDNRRGDQLGGCLGPDGAGRGGGGGGGLGIGGLGAMGRGKGSGGHGQMGTIGGRGSKGPKVTFSGEGTAELRAYLRRKMSRFKSCYEKQLLKKPRLAGKLAMDASGKVAVTATRGLTDARLTACFRRAAGGRVATGKAQAATYAFFLSPQE